MRLAADCVIVLAVCCVLGFYEGIAAHEQQSTRLAQLYAHVLAECANGRAFDIGGSTHVRCKPQELEQ